MKYKKISISLPVDVLIELDKAADSEYLTRSGFIREAVVLRQHSGVILSRNNLERAKVKEFLELLNTQRYNRIIREASRLSWSEIQD